MIFFPFLTEKEIFWFPLSYVKTQEELLDQPFVIRRFIELRDGHMLMTLQYEFWIGKYAKKEKGLFWFVLLL